MTIRGISRLAGSIWMVFFFLGTATAQVEQRQKQSHPSGIDAIAEARELAKRIDEIVIERMRKANIQPAPGADDAVLFRRLFLDLAGRIPDLIEINDYLDDARMDRRTIWIEKLLNSERYADHFGNVWRSILIPEKTDNQGLVRQREFDLWIQEQLRANRPYDQIAKNLLTGLRTKGAAGSPSAFYVAHGNSAEDMAGAAARVLMGVRLECAQCHAHPFADWTRNEFWQMAAFFNRRNVRYTSDGRFVRPEIAVGDTKRTVQATFLDTTTPAPSSPFNGPTVLANWIATKKNPYFSKAAVDHVWTHLIGTSLLDPVLRPDETTIAHPKLLDMLATEFANHDFDLKYLIRAIVSSKTYQRATLAAADDREALAYFARMPIRGLSAEQLYDSLLVATDIRHPIKPLSNGPTMAQNPSAGPRTAFLLKFAGQQSKTETETSVLQALFMMNGNFLSQRIEARKKDVFPVLAKIPIGAERRIRTLYLIVLSRPPRNEEIRRLLPYLKAGGPARNQMEALADIYWALLNSSEFRLNH